MTATSSVTIPAVQTPGDHPGQVGRHGQLHRRRHRCDLQLPGHQHRQRDPDPVVVTDPMAGLSAITCPATSLAPAALETCTATYTTTQADVDAGIDQQHRHGHRHAAEWARRDGHRPRSRSRPSRRPASRWSSRPTSASFTAAGTLVTYSYLVTNTGNVTLNPVGGHRPDAGPLGHHLPGHARWPRPAPRPAPPPTPPPRPTSTPARSPTPARPRHAADRAQT